MHHPWVHVKKKKKDSFVTGGSPHWAPSYSLTRTREVLLPKFKLEKNYNLVEALQSMGVTALFDKNSNMTGISDHRITIDLVTSPLCPLPQPQGLPPAQPPTAQP